MGRTRGGWAWQPRPLGAPGGDFAVSQASAPVTAVCTLPLPLYLFCLPLILTFILLPPLSFSFLPLSRIYFLFWCQFSHNSVLCGSSKCHYLSFFILQAGNPWWILPFVCKYSCKHFYSFLIYQSFLVSTFFLITLFPFSSLQHCCSILMKLVKEEDGMAMYVCVIFTYICKVMYMFRWRFWVTETRINTKT